MELMICVRKERYTLCKLLSLPDLYKMKGFVSVTATEKEISVVCEQGCIPETATKVSDNWVMFEVMGKTDFTAVGIIAEISAALAKKNVPILAMSTYDTDYFLVRRNHMEKAIDALVTTGYPVVQ